MYQKGGSIMDKKQTLDHFRTLTSQELEQVVGGGWLEDLLKHFSGYNSLTKGDSKNTLG